MKNLSKIKSALAVTMLLGGSAFSMNAGDCGCVNADDILSARAGVSTRSMKIAREEAGNGIVVQGSKRPNWDALRDRAIDELKDQFTNATWNAIMHSCLINDVANLVAHSLKVQRSENTVEVLRANFERRHNHCGEKAGVFRDDSQFLEALTIGFAGVENSKNVTMISEAMFEVDVANVRVDLLKKLTQKLHADHTKISKSIRKARTNMISSLNAHATSREFDRMLGITPCEKNDDKVTIRTTGFYEALDHEILIRTLAKVEDPSLTTAKKALGKLNRQESKKAQLEVVSETVSKSLVAAQADAQAAEEHLLKAQVELRNNIMIKNQKSELSGTEAFPSYRTLKFSQNNTEILRAAKHSECGDRYSNYAKTGQALVEIANAHNKTVDAFASEMQVKGTKTLVVTDAESIVNSAKIQEAQALASFKQSLFASCDSNVRSAYLSQLTKGSVTEAKNVLLTEISSLRAQISGCSESRSACDAEQHTFFAKLRSSLQWATSYLTKQY